MAEALRKVGYRGSGAGAERGDGKSVKAEDGAGGGPACPKDIEFRDNGRLRRELLARDALDWAGALRGVSQTQLRNFYSEVKSLQARIQNDRNGEFENYRALVGMLNAKVAYACARANADSKGGFKNLEKMIKRCVYLSQLDESSEAFNDFALFFEAVLGFFRGK